MKKIWIMFFVTIVLVLTLGCSLTQSITGPSKTAGFENGENVLSMGTDCFRCPGGRSADQTSFDQVDFCIEQSNYGSLPQGTEMVVTANENDEFAKFGYLRVTVQIRDHGKICWVSGEEVVNKP